MPTSRLVREAIEACQFKVIICDESHYLKNHKSLSTKTVIPLIKRANRRILLSGTPALSRPVEVVTFLLLNLKSSFLLCVTLSGNVYSFLTYSMGYCKGNCWISLHCFNSCFLHVNMFTTNATMVIPSPFPTPVLLFPTPMITVINTSSSKPSQ